MKAVLGVLFAIVVLAQAGGIVLAQTAPAPPPAGGTFEQRLAQRKTERNIQLDEDLQRRLSQRCTRAQQAVRELQQTFIKLADNRTKTYGRVLGKMWVIIGGLRLARADTFNLERQLTDVTAKVDGFHVVMGYYTQTLDDIAVINCQADLIGFKALLDTARLYYADLRTRSADIRSFVVDQVKPTLAEFAENL